MASVTPSVVQHNIASYIMPFFTDESDQDLMHFIYILNNRFFLKLFVLFYF